MAVRGTFSPARAWRPAVVARLARTLGRTERRFQSACCLVNFCPPASAQVEESARKSRSQILCALSNTVICEHREFSRRNLEELVRGASRRALGRRVGQLSRPRAEIAKAAAGRYLACSAIEKRSNASATFAPNVTATSRLGSWATRHFFPSWCSRRVRHSISGFQWQPSRHAANQPGAA